MRILGIDPGTATTGFGVVENLENDQYKLIDFGIVSTSKDMPHEQRLALIYERISLLLEKHSPDVVAIERLFFATNALTAIAVGQAIGVIKLSICHHHVPVFDYTPMQVKLYVGGSGKADKKVMKEMIKKMLKIRDSHIRLKQKNQTHFDDTADALALAICHARKLVAPPKAAASKKISSRKKATA